MWQHKSWVSRKEFRERGSFFTVISYSKFEENFLRILVFNKYDVKSRVKSRVTLLPNFSAPSKNVCYALIRRHHLHWETKSYWNKYGAFNRDQQWRHQDITCSIFDTPIFVRFRRFWRLEFATFYLISKGCKAENFSNPPCISKIKNMSTDKFIFQKQPFWGVLKKRCSEKMQQIYRRAHMLKCHFNKVTLQNFTGKLEGKDVFFYSFTHNVYEKVHQDQH